MTTRLRRGPLRITLRLDRADEFTAALALAEIEAELARISAARLLGVRR